MVPSTEVRAAVLDDVDEILELWRSAAENADRPGDAREAVVALLARDPDALIVAVREGAIVGTVVAGWDGWRAHLYRLAVRPDQRRRGVARALLDVAHERLVTLGASRLDAMVLQDNGTGQRLWDAAGYAPQERWRRWVRHVR